MDIDATQAIDFDIDEEETCEDSSENQHKPVGYLLLHEQKGLQCHKYPVFEGDNIIGRHESCHICILSTAISKEHACIVVNSGCHLLFDKGSRNKSKRDKLFLTPEVRYELKHNDELTFGDVRCTYTVQTKVSVKDGGSGSETEEEVEKEGDEEDYASDASSDILQPTQSYEDGVLINASNLAHQDKSTNLDAHPTLPEEGISVMETPEFLKKVSRAHVTVTGTLVLPESESETEDELPPETLLFEDSEEKSETDLSLMNAATQAFCDVKAAKKMVNIEATQVYGESDDEDSDPGDHVDFSAATQAMGLGDDMTLDEENKPKSKQGRASPGKQKPSGVETAGVLETQAYSMDTQEDHEDSMDTQNKRDVLDKNKNNSCNQIKSADLAAMETQAMEDKVPDTTEENPDHLSELFCTSTLAFASDDEMDVDGKDKVDETVHFDDETQAIGDSFLPEDPDDKKQSAARFGDETQAIDDGCTPVKEKKKGAAVHFDDETQVIGGLAVDEDKTQAVGEEDATQAVDGDDATQAIDGDDATQAIDGDDATQAVADDKSHAVSGDATRCIGADTAHTGHLPQSAACTRSREVTSVDATQPICDDDTHSKKKNYHASASAETMPMHDTLPVQCSGSEMVPVEEDSTLPISSSVAEEKTPMKGKKCKIGTRGPHLDRDKSAIAFTKFGSEGFDISRSESKTNPEISDTLDLECGGDSTPEIAAEKVANTRDIEKLVGAVEESSSGTFLPQVVTDGEISPPPDATQEIVPESQDVDEPSTAIIKLPEKSPLRPALVDPSSRKRSPSPSPKKVVFADTIKDADSERELVWETEHSTVKLKGTLKTPAAEKLGTKRGRGRKSVTMTEESGAVQHQDKEKTETAPPAKRGRGRGRGQKDTGEVEDKTAVGGEEDTSDGITVLTESAENGDKHKVDIAGDSNSSTVTEEPRRSGRARKARREYSPTPETDEKSGDTSLNSSSVESKKKNLSKKKGGQPDDIETEMTMVNPNRNVDAGTAVPDTGREEAVAEPSEGNTVLAAPEKKQKPVSKGARSRGRSTAGKSVGDITRSGEETFMTSAFEEADVGGSKDMSVKVGNFVAAAEDKASAVEAVEDGTAVADMDSSIAGAGNEVATEMEDNVSTRKSNKDIEIAPIESLPARRLIASRKTKRGSRSQITNAEEEEVAGKADDGNEAAGIGGEEKTQTAADQSAHTSSRTARTGKKVTVSEVLIAASKTENAVSSRRKRNSTTVTETKQSTRQLRNSQDSTEDEQAPVDTDGDFKVPEPGNGVIDELLHTSSRASRSRRRGQSESEKTQRKTTAARTSSLENEETAVDESEASGTDKRRSSLSSKSAADKKKLTGVNKNKESNADDKDKAATDECEASSVEKTELLATENKRQSNRNKVTTSAASRKRKSSDSKDETSTIEEKEASTTEGNDALGVDDSEASAINELEISTAGRRRGRMAGKNATSKIETKALEKEDDDATAMSKKRGSTTITGKISAADYDSETAVGKGRKTTTPRHSLRNSVAPDVEESTAGQSNDNAENDVESKTRKHSHKRKTEDKSVDSKPNKRASRNTKSAEEENDVSNSYGASESSETPAEKKEEQKLMTGRGKGRSKRRAEEKCSSPAPSKHARHNSDEPQMICLQNGSPVPSKRSVKDENRVSSPSLRRSTLSSKPKVLFTGVIDEQGQKMVKDLGGDMAQSIEDCTHIITDKIRRTVKFLGGLARGVSIVTHQWLESSKSAGTFVDASLFLVQDPQMEKQYKFNLVQSIQKASQSPMLQGYRVHVTKSVRPEPQQMKEILTCAGAEYLGSVPSKAAGKMVVISCDEDRATCNPAIKAGVSVVSAEFVLTGILRQEVDVESFRLFGDQSSEASGSASSRKRR